MENNAGFDIKHEMFSLYLKIFLSQTFSHINTPAFLKPSHSSYLPAYEGGTDRAFRNVGI